MDNRGSMKLEQDENQTTGTSGNGEAVMPVTITAAQLPSSRPYTCVKHTSKEAFCLCTKCGDLLCEKCSIQIRGRRYCFDCVAQDDMLREDCFEESVIMPVISTIQPDVPKRISDLPRAILNMFRNSYFFFAGAKDSPFWLTFLLAFVASVPAIMVQYMVKLDAILKVYDESTLPYVKQAGAWLKDMNMWQLAGIAAVGTVFRILIFDLLFFICLRLFSRNELKFGQAASALHFCMVPMIVATVGIALDQLWVTMTAEVLMIVLATSATRAVTKCSFWQGMGAMFLFILMTSFLM